MSRKMPPRLVRSDLSGCVYVITRYRVEKSNNEGKEIIVASVKYDVTDDFNALCDSTRKKRKMKNPKPQTHRPPITQGSL